VLHFDSLKHLVFQLSHTLKFKEVLWNYLTFITRAPIGLRQYIKLKNEHGACAVNDVTTRSMTFFTITAEIHARSLANFYGQYAERHMNLKFMRRVSERARAIRQFIIVKNKLMSVFNESVLLLTMNFVITLSK